MYVGVHAWVCVCPWIIKRCPDIGTAQEQCRAPTWVGGKEAVTDSWRWAPLRPLPVPWISTPPPYDNISYLIHRSTHALRHCTRVGLPLQVWLPWWRFVNRGGSRRTQGHILVLTSSFWRSTCGRLLVVKNPGDPPYKGQLSIKLSISTESLRLKVMLPVGPAAPPPAAPPVPVQNKKSLNYHMDVDVVTPPDNVFSHLVDLFSMQPCDELATCPSPYDSCNMLKQI